MRETVKNAAFQGAGCHSSAFWHLADALGLSVRLQLKSCEAAAYQMSWPTLLHNLHFWVPSSQSPWPKNYTHFDTWRPWNWKFRGPKKPLAKWVEWSWTTVLTIWLAASPDNISILRRFKVDYRRRERAQTAPSDGMVDSNSKERKCSNRK